MSDSPILFETNFKHQARTAQVKERGAQRILLTGTLFKLPSLSTHEFAAVVIAAVFARRLCLILFETNFKHQARTAQVKERGAQRGNRCAGCSNAGKNATHAAQVFEETILLTGTLFKLPSLSTHEFAAVVIAA
jgi:hypothetical protein